MKKTLIACAYSLFLIVPSITFADSCGINYKKEPAKFIMFQTTEYKEMPAYTDFKKCLETAVQIYKDQIPLFEKAGKTPTVSFLYKTDATQSLVNIRTSELSDIYSDLNYSLFKVVQNDIKDNLICKMASLRDRSLLLSFSLKLDRNSNTAKSPMNCFNNSFTSLITNIATGKKSQNSEILYYELKSKMAISVVFSTTFIDVMMLREHLEDNYSLPGRKK